MPKTLLAVHVDPDVYAEVRRIAADQGDSISAFVRKLIIEAIDHDRAELNSASGDDIGRDTVWTFSPGDGSPAALRAAVLAMCSLAGQIDAVGRQAARSLAD